MSRLKAPLVCCVVFLSITYFENTPYVVVISEKVASYQHDWESLYWDVKH